MDNLTFFFRGERKEFPLLHPSWSLDPGSGTEKYIFFLPPGFNCGAKKKTETRIDSGDGSDRRRKPRIKIYNVGN